MGSNQTHRENPEPASTVVDWAVFAPFADRSTAWLQPFVSPPHRLTIMPRSGEATNWHLNAKPTTSLHEWRHYSQALSLGMKQRKYGIITVFPQMAALAGLRKRVTGGKWPLVAYFFNTTDYEGWRSALARYALRAVDVFVVHNRAEIEIYSKWLAISPDRFVFIPLQKPDLFDSRTPQRSDRLIFATGSGRRDYATLFAAVDGLDCRVVVAPGVHAVRGLSAPPNVEIRFDITKREILELSQRAQVNVIPMDTGGPAAGTVTIVEAMRLGAALVVTDRSGVSDYVVDERTALLTPAGDVEALRSSMERLLDDRELRERLGSSAACHAAERFSDEAAGRELSRLLDRFVTGAGSTTSASASASASN